MAVDLKQLCRQTIEEVFGKGNVEVLDRVCADEYRIHDAGSGGEFDREGEKAIARGYKTAFPDLTPTILNCWIDQDGDTVVTNWSMTGTHRAPLMGLAPTGARCTVTGCTISHFRGGKIVEEWAHWDALGLMRQLGVAPGAGVARGASQQQEARPH